MEWEITVPERKRVLKTVLSPLIENSTGWTLTPVAEFLDEELFFNLNAEGRLKALVFGNSNGRPESGTAGRDSAFHPASGEGVFPAAFAFGWREDQHPSFSAGFTACLRAQVFLVNRPFGDQPPGQVFYLTEE